MKKGFTLVELLVVIAIIAVLGTAVVLVLNPAELIKQGRDSTRISDLGNVNNAVALYLSQVESPGIGGINHTACTSLSRCTASTTVANNPFAVGTPACTSSAAVVTGSAVDGSGWVAVKMDAITGGSPLPRLPLDPLFGTNSSSTYFYAYTCSGMNYEIDGRLESAKYASTSAADGGSNANWYELGNNIAL